MNPTTRQATRRHAPVLASVACLLITAAAASAAPQALPKPAAEKSPATAGAVSFTRQVVPILRASCVGCHGDKNPSGKLSLASHAALMKGSEHGPVITPGKAAESRLVKSLTGEIQPKMPLGGSLPADKIALIRRWIEEGARSDRATGGQGDGAKKEAFRTNLTPPATALAYSPDGKTLAVATYQEVQLWDAASDSGATKAASAASPRRVLRGHADAVQALAFSPDGQFLAAGGGEPSVEGEIKIWQLDTGVAVRTLKEHTDAVTALAYSPDGKTLASGSTDKSLRFWDPATGKLLRTVKDHADALYAIAYSPDGKWLASASADRSIKLWDTAGEKRRYSLSGHNDIVYGLAFSPDSKLLASASADKSIRIWEIGADEGKQARTLSGHGHTVHAVAYNKDGTFLASASADQSVKIWEVSTGTNTRTFSEPKEWVYAVAFRPDGAQVAACAWDGSIRLWNPADGTLLATLSVGGVERSTPGSAASRPASATQRP